MREPVDAERIREFTRTVGREAHGDVRVYLTGGATAVLYGWRATTVDIDIKMVPDSDRIFQAIPEVKDRLRVNVELASPSDFIPELAGWEDRSPFISREGSVSFYHYDLYSQPMAKIERGLEKDVADVQQMLRRQLVEPGRLLSLFEEIEPRLFRYPAIDPKSFRRAVEEAVSAQKQ
jgi:hypothetical protein